MERPSGFDPGNLRFTILQFQDRQCLGSMVVRGFDTNIARNRGASDREHAPTTTRISSSDMAADDLTVKRWSVLPYDPTLARGKRSHGFETQPDARRSRYIPL